MKLSIVSLSFLFLILIFIGEIFALPAFLPPLRRRARASKRFRRGMSWGFGVVLFLSLFLSVTYVHAWFTNGLTGLTYPSGYFSRDNKALNAQLDRELWLHFILPPFSPTDSTCFNRDPVICDAAAEMLAYYDDSLAGYLRNIFLALVPAWSCGFMVYYITRDDRKQKIEDV